MILRSPLIVWSLVAYAVLMPVVFVIDLWQHGGREACANFSESSRDWWRWARLGREASNQDRDPATSELEASS